MGKILILVGLGFVLAGVGVLLLGGRLSWLGHLPGDIRIGNSVFIPITTSLLISLVLTVVLNVLVRIFGR